MSENTNAESREEPKDNNDESPLEKQVKVKKPRPPKTAKQIEQFEKIRLKRAEMLKEKKKEKEIESAKLLLDNGYVKKEEQQKINVPLTPLHSGSHSKEDETDNESIQTEPEPIVIIKKKKKPKKPKTIIIEETDSEVSDEEPIKIKARDFISQRNKKSVIKIHKKEPYDIFF
jgi:hypothetical protein